METRRHHPLSGRVFARCEDCGCQLDYDVGSMRWQCVERDECPECAAKRMVDEIFDRAKARRTPTPSAEKKG